MKGALSDNINNEISILRSVQRMTINELKELSSTIQEFLNSQEVKTNASSDTGKVRIKSQDIFNSIGVNKLTSNELEQLKLKVQRILVSHDMKFIKNFGTGKTGLKYQKILTSHGLKKISSNPRVQTGNSHIKTPQNPIPVD
jgi:hypothetical protein